jgi:hypothetical protein
MGRNESFLAGFVVYRVQKAYGLQHLNHLQQNGYWLLYAVFALTLANDQLDAQIFNTFITILYM